MKKILILLIAIAAFAGCTKTAIPQGNYDFNALRDTLHLDSSCVFIETCSPLYSDNNPYGFDVTKRVKTLFYSTYYNETSNKIDTTIYAVYRDNTIGLWGSSKDNVNIEDLINWTINNRDKI